VQYTNTGVDCGCATWQGPFDDDYYDPVLRGDPDPNNVNGGQSAWFETEKVGIPFYFDRYDP
jgi:hypothetical protein